MVVPRFLAHPFARIGAVALVSMSPALLACSSSMTPPEQPVVIDLATAPPPPPPPQAPPTPTAEAKAEPAGTKADPPKEEERQFGMIGLLGGSGDPSRNLGEVFGAGGLGLKGIGTGAGGRGEGIGLGSIGTLGGQGFGGTSGGKPPQVRMGATQISGLLPPEVIQRIVRQHFGRFRACYEKGLTKNPKLQGRVTVKFTIEPDGSSADAKNDGSDLPDKDTVTCVVKVFHGLSFPQPERGKVTVVYPVMFSPGGSAPPATPPAPAKPAAKQP